MTEKDQLDLIPRAGMFTALAPFAKKHAVMLMISSEGQGLRVNVQEKGGDSTVLSLSLFGTPAELDAQLPTALNTARGAAPVLASVAEQVQAQAKPPAAKKATPAGKSKAPKPAAPKKTKITKPKPQAKKTPVKSASKKVGGARAKFTKDQCLAEYVRQKEIHGASLTMDVYAKNARHEGVEIGRSFERMFGGWKKFAKAAEKRNAETGGQQTKPPAADTTTLGEKPGSQSQSLAPPTPISREVYDTEGVLLGTTSQQPTVNEMMSLIGTTPPLPPLKVLAVGAKRITVEAVAETAGA